MELSAVSTSLPEDAFLHPICIWQLFSKLSELFPFIFGPYPLFSQHLAVIVGWLVIVNRDVSLIHGLSHSIPMLGQKLHLSIIPVVHLQGFDFADARDVPVNP